MAKGKDKSDNAGEGRTSGKGGAVKLILGAVVLLGVGAGGAYGAFAMGMIPGMASEHEPDEPKLVLKTESDPYPFAGAGKEKDAAKPVYGEGGSKYRTAYYSFAESFTANLANSPALVQVELAVSTRRDGRVLQWVKTHELAIRSAILAQLAATAEAEAYSVEGKQRISARLTKAINAVLEEKEGFGGIDAVHFKGILVQ